MIRIFTSKTQEIGQLGENLAVQFLKSNGYRITERNVPNKFGEIDIIAKKNKCYYFFEVKTGKEMSSINPAENLSKAKISKFIKSVEYYCLSKKVGEYKVQAIIVMIGEGSKPSIEILDIY